MSACRCYMTMWGGGGVNPCRLSVLYGTDIAHSTPIENSWISRMHNGNQRGCPAGTMQIQCISVIITPLAPKGLKEMGGQTQLYSTLIQLKMISRLGVGVCLYIDTLYLVFKFSPIFFCVCELFVVVSVQCINVQSLVHCTVSSSPSSPSPPPPFLLLQYDFLNVILHMNGQPQSSLSLVMWHVSCKNMRGWSGRNPPTTKKSFAHRYEEGQTKNPLREGSQKMAKVWSLTILCWPHLPTLKHIYVPLIVKLKKKNVQEMEHIPLEMDFYLKKKIYIACKYAS